MTPRGRSAACAALALAILAPAASARAETAVYVSGGTLRVQAAAAMKNVLTATQFLSLITVSDGGDTVTTSGSACRTLDAQTAQCSLSGVSLVSIDALDLNDVITVDTRIAGRVNGSVGDDVITAGPTTTRIEMIGYDGQDRLIGSPRADFLYGGHGADVLEGLGGDDTLAGGPSPDSENGGDGDDVFIQSGSRDRGDVFSGGTGTRDRVDYQRRHQPVIVDLDDIADDGAPGEIDNARSDVEQIVGGTADDTLTGSAAANVLLGGHGNDTLRGLAGADTLSGEAGDDTLLGGAGNDSLTGVDGVLGNDALDGEGDSDACTIDRFDAWANCEALVILP